MGNHLKKAKTKLADRQASFDTQRNTKGFTRPGSMNPHKQSDGGRKFSAKRR